MASTIKNYEVSYAQNREDIVISGFFPDVKNGFYVDVGANHPLYHSVTKRFYDQGWRGVNFEPNPMLFQQMEEHRPKDTNIMQGLGDKEGSFKLRIYHSRDGLEGISTLSKDMQQDYKQHENDDTKTFDDVEIEVTTLKQALATLKPAHIHFLKVDVEGFEYEVLVGNDWDKYRPELICIEANHIMKDWRPLLVKANYEFVFNDGLNDYYLAKEASSRKAKFNYAQTFLLGKPVIAFDTAEDIRSTYELLDNAEASITRMSTELSAKHGRLLELEALVDQITPLRKHIKKSAKTQIKRVYLGKGK